ncbi:MAG: bifunctional 5,10-methylene-tetrahydrofolate dehydrogenase/5,10-methylene-tetrahydrofolate cyclohydrolase, partial [Chlamydiia bacterium]|nr:bifunctional 5,10-methylene-tetrahydrofolate dehydrogenase/5,10-methylene-tetrahydrofolate cyclohydrolase [Chlamydiia bacterium]
KPLAALLMQRGVDATVTVAHSRTENLQDLCLSADILVAAVGIPRFIKKEMVREGASVIDVGINREGKKLVGDVDFDAVKEKCAFITPVPGGVGPMTIAMLLQNTLKARCKHS